MREALNKLNKREEEVTVKTDNNIFISDDKINKNENEWSISQGIKR